MRSFKSASLFSIIAIFATSAFSFAQPEPPKPGKEHEVLKRLEGNWNIVFKAGPADSKGTMVYKMDLGGLWLSSSLEMDMFGTKFTGKGFDSYDSKKKKYVSIWIDSMSTLPMTMEGTYDYNKKTMTLTGEGPDESGQLGKYKSVHVFTDADTSNFKMYTIKDGKENLMMEIEYHRKK